MNKRLFLVSLLVLPASLLYLPIVQANPLAGLFVRNLLQQAFRGLVRRGVGSVGSNVVRQAVSRTATRIGRTNRIRDVFGSQRHNILGRNGRIVGAAEVEGDVLIIRNAQQEILGYLQAEADTLAVYDGVGTRLLSLRMQENRIAAYSKDDDYLGQIIEEIVQDKVESFFVDRFGNKHDTVPVEIDEASPNKEKVNFKNARIRENRLELLDDQGEVLLYGLHESGDIALYDLANKKRALIRQTNTGVALYDLQGILLKQSDSSSQDLLINLQELPS